MINKRNLIILVILIVIALGYIFYKNKEEENIRLINYTPIEEKMINDYELIRNQVINAIVDNNYLCDNNESCSKLYKYNKDNLSMIVSEKDGYVQVEVNAIEKGKYKNVALSGDDCAKIPDMYCASKTIKNNLLKN